VGAKCGFFLGVGVFWDFGLGWGLEGDAGSVFIRGDLKEKNSGGKVFGYVL